MDSKKKKSLQIITALAACAFIVLGTLRSEILIVLDKAVHICFECIGLG
ncbi:MAG: thioredoxin [Roseburia sp.]|nr:thioredoxin [Roseburia sp.]MCM1241494.1 thioredoxin [Roseburia sp.]